MARRLFELSTTIVVRAPLDTVFPFFADPGNLEALTPSFLSFRIVTAKPIAMQAGTRIDYRLKIHGIPVRWRTEITHYEPPRRFVDVQLRGPYRLWHHEHTFRSVPEGTEIGDRVHFLPKGGPLAPLLVRLFVRKDVLAIFGHREKQIASRFGLVRSTPPVLVVLPAHAGPDSAGVAQ